MAISRAKELVEQGYSLREAEKILFKEGMHMRFLTIGRMLKAQPTSAEEIK